MDLLDTIFLTLKYKTLLAIGKNSTTQATFSKYLNGTILMYSGIYQKYTGQEVTVDSQEYIVIRFQDVLAKLVD